MTLPCSCCPIPGDDCFQTNTRLVFTSVTAVNPGGLPIANLASTIDGTAGADLSGFAPPVTAAQLAANPTTAFDYHFGAPQQDVFRLRWFNGGGGDLTDQDGFGLITFQLLDAANVVLYSSPWDLTNPIGNNNLVREITFPPVDNVSTIRFTSFTKQNNAVMGTGSPLLRQVQAFTSTVRPVWRCRDAAAPNTLRWYNDAGVEVAAADVQPCTPDSVFAPPTVSTLTMNGSAFGDGPDNLGENICNVVPAPSGTTGFAAPVGGCYDPTTLNVSMTWTGPLNQVEMEYGNPPRISGGVLISFTSPETGAITWPTNLTSMVPGESRVSNPTPNGGTATFTYLAGPANANGPRMEGGGTIGLHRLTTDGATPTIRYRLTVSP